MFNPCLLRIAPQASKTPAARGTVRHGAGEGQHRFRIRGAHRSRQGQAARKHPRHRLDLCCRTRHGVQGDEGSAQVVWLGHRGTPSVTCSDEVAISRRPPYSISRSHRGISAGGVVGILDADALNWRPELAGGSGHCCWRITTQTGGSDMPDVSAAGLTMRSLAALAAAATSRYIQDAA